MKNRTTSATLQPAATIPHRPDAIAQARNPEILFITSYPPRECGIATYSEDLINAIEARFEDSFEITICALENNREQFDYPEKVKFVLNTDDCESYATLARAINMDENIQMVIVQHEFGLFANCPDSFVSMLSTIDKSKITVFHTILPNTPDEFRQNVKRIAKASDGLIVMTENASTILQSQYDIAADKITVIPHGTHLVAHTDKELLKERYNLVGKRVLSTFGLLSSGKGIETTLDALPEIVRMSPDVMFLVIGRTHPGVVAREGEAYREFLQEKVIANGLENHVRFINKYVPLDELLEYLQLTDIYLFTSKDPNQAVSGTFAYAASCGCAIVSTPIPHAVEYLSGDSGIIVDFQQPKQLAEAVNRLLFDIELCAQIKLNGLHKIVKTAWENVALAHVRLFENLMPVAPSLHYRMPPITLRHVKKMTTPFGMLQFSNINQPDRESGYTLDDNARALIALCQHYEMTAKQGDLSLIRTYLDFIRYCQLPTGNFLNYVDIKENFTEQNNECNLEDANGRAVWALGYAISMGKDLPQELLRSAETTLERVLPNIENWYSTRAMAFAIKGLCYYNTVHDSRAVRMLIQKLADRISQMYIHESSPEWQWFESYLTYANSLLPEALLYAYKETGEETYRDIAQASFKFLMDEIFTESNEIRVISNRNWYVRGGEKNHFGEQPIDVAYTIFALENFYTIFKDEKYRARMESAFEWFLGRNRLAQIVYNPCTGGCYDGIEENNVNLNQGAESTLSYLLARLCMEKIGYFKGVRRAKINRLKHENYVFSI